VVKRLHKKENTSTGTPRREGGGHTHCVLVHEGILTLVELDKQLIPRVFQLSKAGRENRET
jgi:hypothetical protein